MILGFTGKMGTGKSTLCSYLELKSDKQRVRINFKDALVEEMKKNFDPVMNKIAAFYGIDKNLLFQEKPPIMRALMQCYGTEVRRGDDPDYWTKQWKKKVTGATEKGYDVLTDDVRFRNEAEAVREVGGVVIRVVRSDIQETGSHQSEVEMDSIVSNFEILSVKGELGSSYDQLENIIRSL